MIISKEDFDLNYDINFSEENDDFIVVHKETNAQYKLIHQFEDGSKKLQDVNA